MKRNFNQVIKAFNGQPLENRDKKPQKFGELIAAQLYAVNYGKSPEDKLRAYRLSMALAENPESVEITTEDATMIKDVVAQTCAAGIYGQVVDLIEKE